MEEELDHANWQHSRHHEDDDDSVAGKGIVFAGVGQLKKKSIHHSNNIGEDVDIGGIDCQCEIEEDHQGHQEEHLNLFSAVILPQWGLINKKIAEQIPNEPKNWSRGL